MGSQYGYLGAIVVKLVPWRVSHVTIFVTPAMVQLLVAGSALLQRTMKTVENKYAFPL
jgi:hypothetical protein